MTFVLPPAHWGRMDITRSSCGREGFLLPHLAVEGRARLFDLQGDRARRPSVSVGSGLGLPDAEAEHVRPASVQVCATESL